MAGHVFGDTANLKSSQAKALARLEQRSVAPDRVISPALARDLIDLARELNRRIGLFIDRRGRINRVILGDAHSLELPEFARVRGAAGRLRGIRLVVTHLLPEPLEREELADLSKLRLDMVAAVHAGPAGLQVDLAALEVGRDADVFHVRTWPRTPLAVLAGDDEARIAAEHLPVPVTEFLRELEAQLVARTARAREESTGSRAMILQVHQGGPSLEPRQAELGELCRTAGVAVVEFATQRRKHPDPRTFLGAGKLREVLVHALEQDVELLICDPDLSASQAREIANQTDLKVIDRTMLILDIFAQHAKSSDGKLQVELAQLRYRLPRMAGKGTMMSRLAGGIGGRGPGETKLEVDRRRANARIAELERRLRQLRKQRDQQRARRRKAGVPVIALVGYTNAGKSSLLNTITNSDVVAEDKLFATLDPTVRRIRFPREREIVLLDTVGFIRDLPRPLKQAFSATLEEVRDADMLVHVADVTDPDVDQHIATVEAILEDLDAGGVPRVLVFNKCDLLDEFPTRDASEAGAPFYVSARDRRSTRDLVECVETHFWGEAPDPYLEQASDPQPGDDDPTDDDPTDDEPTDDEPADAPSAE